MKLLRRKNIFSRLSILVLLFIVLGLINSSEVLGRFKKSRIPSARTIPNTNKDSYITDRTNETQQDSGNEGGLENESLDSQDNVSADSDELSDESGEMDESETGNQQESEEASETQSNTHENSSGENTEDNTQKANEDQNNNLSNQSNHKKIRAITDLKIEKVEEKLKLSWSKAEGVKKYKIYRSTDPYFTPSKETLIGKTKRPRFTDKTPGIVGDPNNNYFYVVRAVGRGGESENSNRVGEFDLVLVDANKQDSKWKDVVIPLELENISTADQLAQYLDPTGNIKKIARWNNDSQTWVVRNIGSLFGTKDFSIAVGDALMIYMSDETISLVTFTGGVFSALQQSFGILEGMNRIASVYPVEITLYGATFIEDGAHGADSELYADRIWKWDAGIQDYDYAWLIDGVGPDYDGKWWDGEPWGETKITLKPGVGYWYQRRGKEPFIWTNPHPGLNQDNSDNQESDPEGDSGNKSSKNDRSQNDSDRNIIGGPDSQFFKDWEERLVVREGRKKVEAITDLSIEKEGDTLKLSWSRVKRAFFYKVYRSTKPYFIPSQDNLISYTRRPRFADKTPGIVGDPDNNYFYVVRAVGRGGESENSNSVGEFDFTLIGRHPDRVDDFFSLPLKVEGITDADSLAAYIGDVYMILEVKEGEITWMLPGLAGENFPVQVGYPYAVKLNINGIKIVTFVGEVPSPDEVKLNLIPEKGDSYSYNLIALPFIKGSLGNADELAKDIGGVYEVGMWNAETSSITPVWRPSEPDFGENFSITIGQVYVLQLNSDAPTVWPGDRKVKIPEPTPTIGVGDPIPNPENGISTGDPIPNPENDDPLVGDPVSNPYEDNTFVGDPAPNPEGNKLEEGDPVSGDNSQPDIEINNSPDDVDNGTDEIEVIEGEENNIIDNGDQEEVNTDNNTNLDNSNLLNNDQNIDDTESDIDNNNTEEVIVENNYLDSDNEDITEPDSSDSSDNSSSGANVSISYSEN